MADTIISDKFKRMIQTSERVRHKAISNKLYPDKERKSLILKGELDSKYKRLRDDFTKPLDRNDRSQKNNSRRPKKESVPQLVIDLHEQPRTSQAQYYSLVNGYLKSSSCKRDRESISEKLMFPNSNNPLDASSKKTSSSYKNMNLKTKNCEQLREEIELIKTENQTLREENTFLKKRLQRIQRMEEVFQFTTKENTEIKRVKDQLEMEHRQLDQKYTQIREQYEHVIEKLKSMYEQLIRQKRKNKEIRDFVVKMDKQSYFQEQLFSRESIYKNSFQKYENDGKQDYYTSVREAQRSKKDFLYSHAFN